MSYFVLCTFDLKNANRQDYENAYSDLASLGMTKVVVSSQSTKVVIPTTTVAGTFTGTDAGPVRDLICDKVQTAFKARRFSSEIFVVVGGDWAWVVGPPNYRRTAILHRLLCVVVKSFLGL